MRLTQGIEHFTVQFEDAPRIAEQHMAFGSKADIAPVALEQCAFEHVIFEPFHLHADGRLRAVDHFGGTGKTTVIGNRGKGAQQVGIDARKFGH